MGIFKFLASMLLLVAAVFSVTKAQYGANLFPTLSGDLLENLELASSAEKESPVVTIPRSGNTPEIQFTGKYTKGGARMFTKVPYAEPPENERRWKDPEDIDWSKRKDEHGVVKVDATEETPICAQTCGLVEPCPVNGLKFKQVGVEDCLYLNIYAPPAESRNAFPSGYPVMVFIHGGAFVMGWSRSIYYDGDYIASNTNTILVTLNYRLGVLGFLAYDDGAGGTIDGNFGFKDQIKALQWVKNNIGYFGGDVNRITIFGESAGASSVVFHMSSPSSKGLFNQAIIESDPFSIEYLTVKKAKEIGKSKMIDHVKDELNCDTEEVTVQCLRKKDKAIVEEVLRRQFLMMPFTIADCLNIYPPLETGLCEHYDKTRFTILMPWAPVIDGKILTEQPIQTFASNRLASDVPFIIGTNTNEGRNLVYTVFDQLSILYELNEKAYREVVNLFFDGKEDVICNKYPPSDSHEENNEKFSQAFTDYAFTCPARKAVRSIKNADKWVYIFAQPNSIHVGDDKPSFEKACRGKACHADELPYVFHVWDKIYDGSITREEDDLEDAMSTFWVNFAHNGDPNTPCKASHTVTKELQRRIKREVVLPKWLRYTDDDTVMVFHVHSTKEQDVPFPRKEYCDFWDKEVPDYNFCATTDSC